MQTADSVHVKKTMVHLSKNFRNPSDIDTVARVAGVSRSCFRRLFSKWAGIDPERFLRFLAVGHAKEILLEADDVSEAAYQTDLYCPAVDAHVVTCAELQERHAKIAIKYGVHEGPFGSFFLAVMEAGVCALTFLEKSTVRKEIGKLRKIWTDATICEDPAGTKAMADRIFRFCEADAKTSLKVVVKGTDFQMKVWKALVRIPQGRVLSYEGLASLVGAPRASRAVGSACARNQVSYLIPCHRVIRKTGAFGRYGGGDGRKRVLLALEAAQREATDEARQTS